MIILESAACFSTGRLPPMSPTGSATAVEPLKILKVLEDLVLEDLEQLYYFLWGFVWYSLMGVPMVKSHGSQRTGFLLLGRPSLEGQTPSPGMFMGIIA